MLKSLLFVASTATSLAAQIPIQVGLQLDGTTARVRGLSPGLATGTLMGGRGSATLGPLRLSAFYREGRLQLGSSQPLLVEGGAAADVQALPWLSVGLGPAVRAYRLDSTTLRRSWLAGRLGVAAPLIGTSVKADLQLWHSLASLARGDFLTRARGGEVGIAYWAPANVWIRIATTFDDVIFAGPRHERLTGLTLTAGIGH